MTLEDLRDRLDASAARLRGEIHVELVETGLDAQRQAMELLRTRLRVRTGSLWRSVTSAVTDLSDGVQLKVQAGAGGKGTLPYARIQEEGGIVRPVKGKFLAIPVGKALTPKGVPKFASPRDVPDLRYVQSRKGQPMLVRETGSGKGKNAGKVDVLFLLRQRVDIRGKHYLRDGTAKAFTGVQDRLRVRVGRLLGEGA